MPTWREMAAKQIKADEQSSVHARYPYLCPSGALTIGWGHNIDRNHGGPGLSRSAADFILGETLDECEADLAHVHPHWVDFSDARKAALANVRFQLGPNRYRLFADMITAINIGDWAMAADELVDSKMGREQKERTLRRANELRNG